ncbi:MAG: hypothetical protein AAGA67_07940 [Cyanobacteria bacterium P01_F01_bin.153]
MVTTPIPVHQEKVLLQGVSWSTYRGLTYDLAEKPSKRLTYDHQWLEIMTPLLEHEANKRLLGRIVEATTEEARARDLQLEFHHLEPRRFTTWSRA